MAREAAHAEDYARMLDRVRRVIEHRANRADAGLHDAGAEFFQPVRGDYLDIVVEETNDRRVRIPDSAIVGARIIEWMLVVDQQPQPLVYLDPFDKALLRRSLQVLAIGRDDEFDIGICRLAQNARHGPLNEFKFKRGGNDDRYLRRG